jgi:hypothetical protein
MSEAPLASEAGSVCPDQRRMQENARGKDGSRRGRGAGARGFFLRGFLCFQGRDPSDQHIVDVVLKMMQGEGRAATPPHSHCRAW